MIDEHDTLRAWKKTISYVHGNGTLRKDDVGNHNEILNIVIRIRSTTHANEPITQLSRFSEFVYPTINDVHRLIFDPSLTDVYTHANRILKFRGKTNQLDDVIIPLLQKDPATRRAVIQIFDPLDDGEQSVKPSVLSIHFFIRDDALHLSAFMRSCDVFLGLPVNMLQFSLLLEYISKKIKVPTGSMTIFCASAHLYCDSEDLYTKIMEK